ncbi:hypothetical protein Nepgr_020215 [Nepenthes gracilis]|uniref:Tic22-like family protein n=1 Tax=Nepenthes gracilis TaxID=150966 RepID=A0AAD3XVU5_NEPGR|nr:hypothetical protein Nepgr_020215 [Nepenthes gracilis]
MASATERHGRGHLHHSHLHLSRFIQTATSNFLSLLTPIPVPSTEKRPLPSIVSTIPSVSLSKKIFLPLPVSYYSRTSIPLSPLFHMCQNDSLSAKPVESSANTAASSESGSEFPSTVRIGSLSSTGKCGGPAFVGQVFSMCDLTGTGLMAVSTHFNLPFLSKRTPEWMKKMFTAIGKSDNGPVFRFFIDLSDAVGYVKRLNIPSGVVGACRLDLAYEHFKEKPHLFQFVPNEKQVKAAKKLLKKVPTGGKRTIDGVPVFSAQNLDIAIATTDGIKWYTPYFFDKNILDNILEESVDQHFHSLIQSRRLHRRRDVIDDNLTAEVIEESGDNIWEPSEVQELMDEMGSPGIPLSVISKAAEMQLLYAVDKLLLGNRWLRKATGIQPKFPYMVDSFEKRSAASFTKVSESSNNDAEVRNDLPNRLGSWKCEPEDNDQASGSRQPDFRFPFGDWFNHQQNRGQENRANTRMAGSNCIEEEIQPSPLLPKITMVGVSTSEPGRLSNATLKKTMEELVKELEHDGPGDAVAGSHWSKFSHNNRDPLFVANVGDYYSSMAKTSSARWVRGGNGNS